MNNEETRILNQNQTEDTTVKTPEKKSNKSEKAAYAAGGFAAGVASGVAGSAMAVTPETDEVKEEVLATSEPVVEDEPVKTENIQEEPAKVEEQSIPVVETPQPAPNPEEVLLATDEGVRIAQVNDDVSFSQAFADARAQVGPGGAFEWRGHVYSTYYEEEWNNMSAEERANYQSKIDYETVAGEPTPSKPSTTTTEEVTDVTPTVETATAEPSLAANAEMVDEQSAQGGIKVLGVEAVVDPQGNPMTIAAIEIDNEQALLVDVDNNGMMDVIMVDENHDGQISENEIYDASDAGISTADLQHHMAASQDPGMLMASNDGMPDYMNDADVRSMA